MDSPFENIQNDDPADSMSFRVQLLGDTKRGFAKVRKAFVQRTDEDGNRASMLSALVKGKKERAFDALMLLLALEPILDGTPLPLRTWAKMIGSEERPCSSQSASLAFDTLVDYNLVTRTNKGRTVIVAPRLEDGSRAEWDNPGSNPATIGKGYLTHPTRLLDHWPGGSPHLPRQGAVPRSCCRKPRRTEAFAMAAERAPSWYGICERTGPSAATRNCASRRPPRASRCCLNTPSTSATRGRPRATGRLSTEHSSAPYSQAARAELQLATRNAVRRIAAEREKAAEAETNEAAESV